MQDSFLGLNIGSDANLSTLYRVLTSGTHVLPRLRQFWDTFQTELANENSYKASINRIKLRLSKLQKSDAKAQIVRMEELNDSWEEFDGVLHY